MRSISIEAFVIQNLSLIQVLRIRRTGPQLVVGSGHVVVGIRILRILLDRLLK